MFYLPCDKFLALCGRWHILKEVSCSNSRQEETSVKKMGGSCSSDLDKGMGGPCSSDLLNLSSERKAKLLAEMKKTIGMEKEETRLELAHCDK